MEVLILFSLILLNGFFALSEVALITCRKSRLEELKKNGVYGADTALKLTERSENFLSAIQVGISLIGIVTGVYGGINFSETFVPFLSNVNFLAPIAKQLALILTVVIITYFSIVLGELVPKTIGLSKPENYAARVAPIIYFFSKLFYPFVWLLSISTSLINTLLGITRPIESLSEKELKQMIQTATTEGVIPVDQQQLHEKIFTFSDKRAKHIMTHRTEVLWIDLQTDQETMLNQIINSKHERIVCANGNLDNFVGVLQTRNYLTTLIKKESVNINEFISPLYVIPENTPAQTILNSLREKHINFCVVVDEYGSFEGIITLHDIFENLVGELIEEDEIEGLDVIVRNDQSLLVNGDAPIGILQDYIPEFEIDFEKVSYATVAGFALENLNSVPKEGDKFTFEGYTFEILDMDGNRIDKLLVYREKSGDEL